MRDRQTGTEILGSQASNRLGEARLEMTVDRGDWVNEEPREKCKLEQNETKSLTQKGFLFVWLIS